MKTRKELAYDTLESLIYQFVPSTCKKVADAAKCPRCIAMNAMHYLEA